MFANDPIDRLQADLYTKYPATFGGLFMNEDGTFGVATVGDAPDLVAATQAALAAAAQGYGVDVAPEKLQLTVNRVDRSLHELYLLRDQVLASMSSSPAGQGQSVGAFGTGVDPKHNQVVVYSDSPNPQNVSLDSVKTPAPNALRVEVAPVPREQERTNDTPPWNSGDDISPAGGGGWCTLGWGLHNASGQHYNMTAGHCGDHEWHNTDHNSPKILSNNLVGTTLAGGLSQDGADLQLLPDSSSTLMWRGPIGAAVSTTMVGYANPPTGATVCREGATRGEQCGPVTAVDQTVTLSGHVKYNMIIFGDGANPCGGLGGDSGGPILFPSIYGPLAGATIIGGDAANTGYGQEIGPQLYVFALQQGQAVYVNVASNP